jgi:hypothetical protein
VDALRADDYLDSITRELDLTSRPRPTGLAYDTDGLGGLFENIEGFNNGLFRILGAPKPFERIAKPSTAVGPATCRKPA